MVRPIIAVALLALPLVACGPKQEEKATTNIVVPEGDYAERLHGMTENERNAVFYRAIHDAGRPCQQVRESTAIAPIKDAPSWVATCEDGGRWVIILGKAGIAQVTNAAELEAATGGTGTP
ncbi:MULTISPECIES: hypothetical protein [Sphingomonadales]|uniref:Lipoprotein n=2 Tax=Edaphosphingomonas TaxID=3423724 RepID=A0A2T4I7Y3_9SPHN|nr:MULTISPECIES: hypothetical protein [Sphingomonas]AGH49270.1 hypothetical protein G432_07725 [Sphingomonas sp. MM-1]MDX3886213.1 hypothetical protein [Sphingomonas sp.]OHT21924.1 hypothetical protein BHE75_03939 [Sphingomonas haloaromaticamans]PTD27576.1 hypothetical protein CV103_01375 [Sphingomonas fennica]